MAQKRGAKKLIVTRVCSRPSRLGRTRLDRSIPQGDSPVCGVAQDQSAFRFFAPFTVEFTRRRRPFRRMKPVASSWL